MQFPRHTNRVTLAGIWRQSSLLLTSHHTQYITRTCTPTTSFGSAPGSCVARYPINQTIRMNYLSSDQLVYWHSSVGWCWGQCSKCLLPCYSRPHCRKRYCSTRWHRPAPCTGRATRTVSNPAPVCSCRVWRWSNTSHSWRENLNQMM